jgi:hypothetical protein
MRKSAEVVRAAELPCPFEALHRRATWVTADARLRTLGAQRDAPGLDERRPDLAEGVAHPPELGAVGVLPRLRCK